MPASKDIRNVRWDLEYNLQCYLHNYANFELYPVVKYYFYAKPDHLREGQSDQWRERHPKTKEEPSKRLQQPLKSNKDLKRGQQ